MKNSFYLYLFIIFFMFSKPLIGQQLPIFNNPNTASAIVNPAFINMNYLKYDNNMSMNLGYIYQWTELEGAPRTLTAGYEYFLEDINFLVGGNIVPDQTGPISFTGFYGRGGYHLKITDDLSIAAALSIGALQYRINANELIFLESGDIAAEDDMKLMPDFSIGAMVYGKSFYAGISIPQSFGLNLEYSKGDNNFNLSRVQHYYALAGGYFPMFNDSWLEVFGWAKYVANVPFHLGIGMKYEYHEDFYIGASYSTSKALTAQTGFIFEVGGVSQCDFGYSITNHFANFGFQFGLTHELRLSYSLARY